MTPNGGRSRRRRRSGRRPAFDAPGFAAACATFGGRIGRTQRGAAGGPPIGRFHRNWSAAPVRPPSDFSGNGARAARSGEGAPRGERCRAHGASSRVVASRTSPERSADPRRRRPTRPALAARTGSPRRIRASPSPPSPAMAEIMGRAERTSGLDEGRAGEGPRPRNPGDTTPVASMLASPARRAQADAGRLRVSRSGRGSTHSPAQPRISAPPGCLPKGARGGPPTERASCVARRGPKAERARSGRHAANRPVSSGGGDRRVRHPRDPGAGPSRPAPSRDARGPFAPTTASLRRRSRGSTRSTSLIARAGVRARTILAARGRQEVEPPMRGEPPQGRRCARLGAARSPGGSRSRRHRHRTIARRHHEMRRERAPRAKGLERVGRMIGDEGPARLWIVRNAPRVARPSGALMRLRLLTGRRRSETSRMRGRGPDLERGRRRIAAGEARNDRPRAAPPGAETLAEIRAAPRQPDGSHGLATDGDAGIRPVPAAAAAPPSRLAGSPSGPCMACAAGSGRNRRAWAWTTACWGSCRTGGRRNSKPPKAAPRG
ncbi:hypothetical protein SAMN05216258_11131 [Albimonas pacifica]|uniref:Uncharacterized protein n=1 Tax=Albimonas pacifica TaxID=1114924 RepID=A0A1I3MBP7_9RHOB|nr:hypothetical protein SAMN05216258_11131 [Albimonas pacifica]